MYNSKFSRFWKRRRQIVEKAGFELIKMESIIEASGNTPLVYL